MIARLVQADEDTVRDVIHKFNQIGLTCLDPLWAGGRPRLLSDDDEDFVIQTATTRPAKRDKPFTRWSIRKLADHLRRDLARPIRIGREALRCLLARRGITFQRTKTWKESTDLDFDAKLDRIEYVLHERPDRTSPSTSSGRWASARRPGPAGPSGAGRTGCRRPITALTAPATSMAATRSATTPCGASTDAARASARPGPRSRASVRPARTAPRSM